jgi:hypothetical protein
MAGYVSAILFTESREVDGDGNEDDSPMAERFSIWNLPAEFYAAVRNDCLRFVGLDQHLVPGRYVRGAWLEDPCTAGMDFWYTRQGHGVSFKDSDVFVLAGVADYLCSLANKFREAYVYIGDDGQLHHD